MGCRGRKQGRLLRLSGDRGDGRAGGAVSRLSQVGLVGHGLTIGTVCAPGQRLMPQLLPPSHVLCPSLPILLHCILFPSEKNENYWSFHCAPTMCSLSLHAFIPGFAPSGRRVISSRTPAKGSRKIEKRVRTWEKYLGQWIPWKDPRCQHLSCC